MIIVWVLPAYAGMIRPRRLRDGGLHRAPRVCGDDPYPNSQALAKSLCSPRMRG